MHIIRFNGGVGNQLFQYAFYKYCQTNNILVFADLSIYNRRKIHGGFLLNKMLPNNTLKVTEVDVEDFYRDFTLPEKVYNKMFHHVGKHYFEEYFRDYSQIIPFLKKKQNCYLDGWWQYRNMALSEVSQIQTEMQDIGICIPYNKKDLLRVMCESESVSVHIRRGDYLNADALYGNICTDAYYNAAFNELKKRVIDPVFFIFSDDEDYCKMKYSNEHVVIVPSSNLDDAYLDIILMSKCKHHITANSSFSWWGTALSEKKGIIVMPSRHNNRMENNPLAFENSLIIDNVGQLITRYTNQGE